MDKKSCDTEKRNMTMGKAILKLSAYVNCGMLTVHILKARHLYSTENPHCHPFVQVCLAPDTSGGTKCCTAVTQNSPHSTFNEKFSFELLLPTDSKKRLHVSVWNCQASESSPSEFLGAMSFGLNSLLSKNKEINGWYYLLKEDIGKKKHLPAVLRSVIYGEIGSPLHSPECPETPLMEAKHTRISQRKNTLLTDVMVHRDVNGNHTNNTEAACLDCPLPLRDSCDDGHYFDKIAPNGQVRSFHSSFRLGRRPDHAHTKLTTVNLSPIPSSKHVRFTTSESQQAHTTNGVPKNLPVPEKSALKSPPMRRSLNPYVLQYRQEIASVEKKVMMNSQKQQGVDSIDINKVVADGKAECSDHGQESTPDIIKGEDITVRTNGTTSTSNKTEVSTKGDTPIPVSVMGYPSQFREECIKATSDISDLQKHSSSCSKEKTGDCKEIWIDCQSLESTNTTQDSGICDSSSPKSEDHEKYQETSFCHAKHNTEIDRDISVYKDSHLEPSAKCKVDITKKYTEQFQIGHEKKLPTSKSLDVAHSSHDIERSKLSSASFCDSNPYKGCESCAVKYCRHLYSPVLGKKRLADKQETTHTKIYFL